jgi:hypothetical protein
VQGVRGALAGARVPRGRQARGVGAPVPQDRDARRRVAGALLGGHSRRTNPAGAGAETMESGRALAAEAYVRRFCRVDK